MIPVQQAVSQALSSASKPTSSRDANATPPSVSAQTSRSGSTTRVAQAVLDNFWARMGALFGHTWTSQYGDAPAGIAGDTWAAALAGLSGAQVAVGLRETLVLGSEFPPSAPHFRALCFGIPSWPSVKPHMRPGAPPPTAFVRAMWSRIDGWSFQRADADKAERMARDAYETTRESVMRGEQLPVEPVAFIASPVPVAETPATPEVAQRYLREIAEKLGISA